MEPKLTPNFRDQHKGDPVPKRRRTKGNGAVPIVAEAPHVEAAHEPLPGETWTPPVTVYQATQPWTLAAPAPTPVAEVQPLKVALIGTAPSSRMLAPFNDPSWEIWGCSPGNMNLLPRVTRWFEIHCNLLWPENENYGRPYIEWLKQQQFPKGLYMQDQSLVPHAIAFPMNDLVKEFGTYFFTSSFAWMMALAIKEGAKEIALYGVDMASRDEYILQRSGGHYFIQLAKQRGIKVTLPFESDLEQPPSLYGFSEATPFSRKLHARELELRQRLAQMTGQRDQLNQNITYLQGALEDLDYWKTCWGGVQHGLDLRNLLGNGK